MPPAGRTGNSPRGPHPIRPPRISDPSALYGKKRWKEALDERPTRFLGAASGRWPALPAKPACVSYATKAAASGGTWDQMRGHQAGGVKGDREGLEAWVVPLRTKSLVIPPGRGGRPLSSPALRRASAGIVAASWTAADPAALCKPSPHRNPRRTRRRDEKGPDLSSVAFLRLHALRPAAILAAGSALIGVPLAAGRGRPPCYKIRTEPPGTTGQNQEFFRQ
jgi:hypothetical protein